MCFAPQPRALFRHLNLQKKWSEPLVFCTFWLGNVLRATTACSFSTSEPPKVVRTPAVFNILTWKCASRHNGVWFFIFHVAKWFVPAALASPLFDPHHPQIIGKTQCFATFRTLRARVSSFSDFLPSLLYFFFYSCLLCFSSLHIVGSLTSKISLVNFLWYAMTSW